MKFVQTVLAIATVAFAVAVSATPEFDPATLGHMQAVMASCGQVDRQEASQYLLEMKAMIGDATKSEVDKIAKSQAYRIAYRSVRDDLKDRPPKELAAACSVYLSEAN